ncbi:MAG: tRNA uridine-5-carboxymethylaminomethyl(34) synthesis enzyme MnmG [Clostridia bacterium]|nr:tRNA uridine-5-carboxymethylaminomethyl(34) synthesis enzyme MnmG [Clostridia bacterium]
MDRKQTSVLVIGAGHAGIEAALAASRMGVETVLLTLNLDAVGNMPCNPSIGGTGKGHLVFEIDALGGEMGRAADAVTIQSRTLNLGKGAAVHSKRVQADRFRYRERMKHTLETAPRLRLLQAEATRLLTRDDPETGRRRVVGVETSLGETILAQAVVVATGTFLDSRVFVGHKNYAAGPDGMTAAASLSASLSAAGVRLRRFKTGTPARINRRSIDFSQLEEQKGEETPTPFSFETDMEAARASAGRVSCYVLYTNAETHRVIREHLADSALYAGDITGTGPRYCPSIETKLVRFADKERHQLFLEPCGLYTDEMYLQGLSTSMPVDVQEQMIRTLPGLAHAEIMRYAYAIEYDCADPIQMDASLMFKSIEGLFGAGQFNGTSGYEEAAAQGLIAGINAARFCLGRPPVILPRASSYIGTLIDDLVTKGTDEPYRIMTSRSEYRLLLRQDNADLRLSEIGHEAGLLGEERYAAFRLRKEEIEREIERLESVRVPADETTNRFLAAHGSTPLSAGVRLAELLRRPEWDYASLAPLDPARPALPARVRTTAEMQIKYEGYIRRQIAEAKRNEKLENKKIPPDIDYKKLTGLRLEAIQKLSEIRPVSIGQAARISGVNPADVSVLLIWLSQGAGRREEEKEREDAGDEPRHESGTL